jgi:DNA-binding CsgD family transcriptional regulator
MTETIDPQVIDTRTHKIHAPVRSPLEHTIEVLTALVADMHSFLSHYQQVYPLANGKIRESCGVLENSIELWSTCVQDCLYALQHLPCATTSSDVYSMPQWSAEHEQVPIRLTERELEVLLLLARGLSVKETARVLTVSEKTVRTHLGHLYHKLDINDRTQLVIYALKRGLIRLQSI